MWNTNHHDYILMLKIKSFWSTFIKVWIFFACGKFLQLSMKISNWGIPIFFERDFDLVVV